MSWLARSAANTQLPAAAKTRSVNLLGTKTVGGGGWMRGRGGGRGRGREKDWGRNGQRETWKDDEGGEEEQGRRGRGRSEAPS